MEYTKQNKKVSDQDGVYTLGKNNRYGFYSFKENPNQTFKLPNSYFPGTYEELLTDGKVRIEFENIHVEDASFTIVREKCLGSYEMAHLYTEVDNPVYLAYYNYLTSSSYLTLHKEKKHVYTIKKLPVLKKVNNKEGD